MSQSECTSITDIAVYKQSELVPIPFACWKIVQAFLPAGFLLCLILIFTSQSTLFQSCQDGSSWVEPILSRDKCVLLKPQGDNAVLSVRLEPATLRSQHSTTEPLHSLPAVLLFQKIISGKQKIKICTHVSR